MGRFEKGDLVVIRFEGNRHEETDLHCGWEDEMVHSKGKVGIVGYRIGSASRATNEPNGIENENYEVLDYGGGEWCWHVSALHKCPRWKYKKLVRHGEI